MITKLFEAMRNDLAVMADFGDDESALLEELEAADEEVLEAYREAFLD